MRHPTLILLVPMLMLVSCGTSDGRDTTLAAPQRDAPEMYLVDHSYDHVVTITMDGQLVWSGEVPRTDRLPNIHKVSVPSTARQEVSMVVAGGPYRVHETIDWRRGHVLLLHFGAQSVSIRQQRGPVGFQ